MWKARVGVDCLEIRRPLWYWNDEEVELPRLARNEPPRGDKELEHASWLSEVDAIDSYGTSGPRHRPSASAAGPRTIAPFGNKAESNTDVRPLKPPSCRTDVLPSACPYLSDLVVFHDACDASLLLLRYPCGTSTRDTLSVAIATPRRFYMKTLYFTRFFLFLPCGYKNQPFYKLVFKRVFFKFIFLKFQYLLL